MHVLPSTFVTFDSSVVLNEVCFILLVCQHYCKLIVHIHCDVTLGSCSQRTVHAASEDPVQRHRGHVDRQTSHTAGHLPQVIGWKGSMVDSVIELQQLHPSMILPRKPSIV